MAITIPSRRVAPQTAQQPTQAALVDESAPIVNALDIVGRTTSSIAETSIQVGQLDAKAKKKAEADLLAEKLRRDRSKVTEAVTIDKGAMSDYLNQIKTQHTKGEASAIPQLMDAFNKKKTENTLENLPPELHEMYAEAILPHTIAYTVDGNDYTRKQEKVGRIASATSSKAISAEMIVTNYENPLVYAVNRANIEDQNEILGDENGWDSDTEKLELDKSLAAMEEARLRKWSIKDATVAKELFEINKDLFSVEKQGELNKIFDTENAIQQGGTLANDAMEQGTTEGERLDWLKKNAVKDEATMKEARAQVRKQSEDKRDEAKRDNIKVNDGILDDAYAIRDAGGTRTDALKLTEGATSATDRNSLEASINGIFKRVDELPPDNTTDKYATHLTDVYQDIEAGQYASLSQLRRSTLGRLTDADQSDVETHFKQGGLLGGLGESSIQDAFFSFAGYSANDIPVTYQNARRIIVANVKSLPPGRTSVNETEIRQWMSDAVRGQADSGNIPTKESIGVTDQLTDKQRDNVISQMEAGNAKRISEGKTPYPINTETIARASANVYPRVKEEPPVIEPVIIAPAPVFGGELLTAEQIQTQAETTGQTVSPGTAKQLEREQFPGEQESRVGETLKEVIKISDVPERFTFEEPKSEIKSFEEYVPILVQQLTDEGLDFTKFSPQELDTFYKEEYKKFVGKAIGDLLTDKK